MFGETSELCCYCSTTLLHSLPDLSHNKYYFGGCSSPEIGSVKSGACIVSTPLPHNFPLLLLVHPFVSIRCFMGATASIYLLSSVLMCWNVSEELTAQSATSRSCPSLQGLVTDVKVNGCVDERVVLKEDKSFSPSYADAVSLKGAAEISFNRSRFSVSPGEETLRDVAAIDCIVPKHLRKWSQV